MSFDPTTPVSRRAGAFAALGAFGLWGVFPLYWKALEQVAAIEIIAHRVAWSLLLLLVILGVRGELGRFRRALLSPRLAGLYALSGLLLGANWLIYIWAVNAGHIVETSLGYFLTPLLNVALGFLVLRERLRPLQWLAVSLAAIGVLVQLVQLGRLPWIALGLATSFGFYGLLRKQGPLGSLAGLAVETAVLAPAAIVFLAWREGTGVGALGYATAGQQALIFSSGIVTTIPLLLFATAARALPLATLGLFQYLAPTIQLLIGVAVYGEAFGGVRAASFGFIWVALAIYSVDGWRAEVARPGATSAGPRPVRPFPFARRNRRH